MQKQLKKEDLDEPIPEENLSETSEGCKPTVSSFKPASMRTTSIKY